MISMQWVFAILVIDQLPEVHESQRTHYPPRRASRIPRFHPGPDALLPVGDYLARNARITVFLHNGGTLEAAQDMANHSDPHTTKLYDRRKYLATLSEIERRIAFE